ncbi:MAG: ABC transporter ATP-binding protein [Clostridia bacterium]|nr:ABC transporter ATP-binding protein [Clostridia bacterium]
MASLKLNGVDKIYPSGTTALYDINLETDDKEFIVILGNDGSGKTSLLRVIAGLDDLSSGEIVIGGKDVTEADPKDRDIAMVFRNNTLSPTMTVFDNMAFGLRLRKAPQTVIEQRVKAAANILGLTDVLYRKPKVLTAGQKQRTAIGRAIVREPKLYLFDEPLSGLDEKLQAELLNVIVNLQARMQGTFLYSTKSVAEAMTVGTRIVVLKNGFVQQIDTPENLYDYPANAYVAFLIGSPTINFINNAKIIKDGENYYAAEGNIKLLIPENILKRFTAVEEYADSEKQVIIGIRPEDVKEGGEIVANVIGEGEGFVEVEADGHSFTIPSDKLKKGAKTGISVDATKLYLFDGETRLTLLDRDGGYKKNGFADSDFVPRTFKEEEEIKEKLKPEKDGKKKKQR